MQRIEAGPIPVRQAETVAARRHGGASQLCSSCTARAPVWSKLHSCSVPAARVARPLPLTDARYQAKVDQPFRGRKGRQV